MSFCWSDFSLIGPGSFWRVFFISRERSMRSLLFCFVHCRFCCETPPIGGNFVVLISGEPHQNSVFRSFNFLRGVCAAKTGFDGLSSVVLLRFHLKFSLSPGISSYGRSQTFGRAMYENLVLSALDRSKGLGARPKRSMSCHSVVLLYESTT
jgi:hypothetical protein